MKAAWWLGWWVVLSWIGVVAGPGCGTEPVAPDACRKIEEVRCELAPSCPGLNVSDVDACKRFYRDQCLHGLAIASDPGAPVVDTCVAALRIAAACTTPDSGCVATTIPVKSGCEVVARPELAEDCKFLIPPSTQVSTGPTLAAGNGGAAGGEGSAGVATSASGSGM
ncbi:MAG: hypothetical protein RMJ98_12750 [Myxococcales bacterium]|nr:hypothetical protein [Polyangiaceae bacterium]MDW8250155.1 hypothetical protein [Myxococcales bacterium]